MSTQNTTKKYRVETNDSRRPVSQWFDSVPNGLCGALNMEAYHRGQGGLYGVYDEAGRRVHGDS